MSKKEELESIISRLKEQLLTAQEQLENLKEHKRFTPEEFQDYYYVEDTNTVFKTCYSKDFPKDKERCEVYNCFQTEEEAEKEANKILIRRKLEDIANRLNDGEKIDWNDQSQRKYLIRYSYDKNEEFELYGGWSEYMRTQGTVYCLSEDFLKVAIEEIGEQELIDYIKGE